MAEEKKDRKENGGLFIPAGIFLGLGIGFLTGNLIAWMFIGMGLGFIGFAISMVFKK